ncbi:unnamed protein product [Brassica rapa]|uniref:Uncharacterized protein n=2 Tax=Brassica TaxID=3705 RepID=A0A8D9CSL9_BRACM|nr:unnamed protein product [Brassica napus]CAG7862038.1 unnamed protein product [Brassica rapa]
MSVSHGISVNLSSYTICPYPVMDHIMLIPHCSYCPACIQLFRVFSNSRKGKENVCISMSLLFYFLSVTLIYFHYLPLCYIVVY